MSTEGTTTADSTYRPRRKRYFSVAEANRALPYISRVVRDLSSTYRAAIRAKKASEEEKDDHLSHALASEYDKHVDRLNDLDRELRNVGAELKDVHMGLVDFPALHDGREVSLCWRYGEKAIMAWHEVDAGFNGRQDVSLLDASSRAVT